MPEFCNVCKVFGLFKESILFSDHASESHHKPSEGTEVYQRKHHLTIGLLRLSAEAGCLYCHRVWSKLRHEDTNLLLARQRWVGSEDEFLEKLDALRIDLKVGFRPGSNGDYEINLYFWTLWENEGKTAVFDPSIAFSKALFHPSSLEKLTTSGADLTFDVLKQALPYQSTALWPEHSTKQKTSFEWARYWINHCLWRHPSCSPENASLPSRLVFVGSQRL